MFNNVSKVFTLNGTMWKWRSTSISSKEFNRTFQICNTKAQKYFSNLYHSKIVALFSALTFIENVFDIYYNHQDANGSNPYEFDYKQCMVHKHFKSELRNTLRSTNPLPVWIQCDNIPKSNTVLKIIPISTHWFSC